MHIDNKTERFGYKSECGMCRCDVCIEAFKRRADMYIYIASAWKSTSPCVHENTI